MDPLLLFGIITLLVALVLYFVFLPHWEGPSLAEQEAAVRHWLVKCPQCGRWKLLVPFSHEEQTNWYQCPTCHHKWPENL